MIEIIINAVTTFIVNSISSLGYLGIVAMMAIESACIPLPSEVIMPFSGFLASTGRFSLLGVILAGSFGSVIGSLVAYFFGFFGGRIFLEKYGKYLLISHYDLDLADKFFQKHGAKAAFFTRMMPIFRTFISLPAGIAKMNLLKLTVYTFVGSIPWCWALAFLGKKLGENWQVLGSYFKKFDFIIISLIIIAIILYIIRHIKNERKYKNLNQSYDQR